jgi:hypothetical protein
MSYGLGPRLLAEVGFGAATCPMASDLASRSRWAPALSCILWLWTSPSGCGGLRCCHVSRGSLWTASFKHKEKTSRSVCAARHACSECTCTCFQGASHQGHHASARRAARQCSQYLQGMWTSIYNMVTVRCQHYGPLTRRAHTVEDIICYSSPLVSYCIRFYLPQGHLSGLESHCNCPTLGHKRPGQMPVLGGSLRLY